MRVFLCDLKRVYFKQCNSFLIYFKSLICLVRPRQNRTSTDRQQFKIHFHTYTHTHKMKERERERGREGTSR